MVGSFAAQGRRVQHLHLVGFTAELDGLIFSAGKGSKAGGYVVSLDHRLLDSIREAIRLKAGGDTGANPNGEAAPGGATSVVPDLRRLRPVHSALSPKEIQARLRTGRSVAEVAEEGGVDESWILRFASPVLAEQARVVERALQVHCHAARKGESALTLGESVERNVVDRGAPLTPDELSGAWSSYHLRDGAWVVRFRYLSRRRVQTAQWAFDLADLSLVPMDRLATELGFVDPASRRRPRPSEGATANDRDPGGDHVPGKRTARSPRRVGGGSAPVGRPAKSSQTRSAGRATPKAPARATRAVKAPKVPARATKAVTASKVSARAVKAAGATRVARAPKATKTPPTPEAKAVKARATRVSGAHATRSRSRPAPSVRSRVVAAPTAATQDRSEGTPPGGAHEPGHEPSVGAVVIQADWASPTTSER
ncbi:MAG: hypothetical protein NVSMB16_07240 [Acidimicrobiales bacterium]